MALVYTHPIQILNMDFEREASKRVCYTQQPRVVCNFKQLNEMHKEEQVAVKDSFHVSLDVKLFSSEEISIKVADKTIIVDAKHGEKEDENGTVYRHFVRKYIVGEDYDLNNIESTLSTDGVLSIIVPPITDKGHKCRVVPIIQTGKFANSEVKTGEKIINVVLE